MASPKHGALALFVHDQVLGFLRIGTRDQQATGAVDRGASKLLAGALGAAGLAVAAMPITLDFLPPRLVVKALLVSLLLFGSAARYWRGASTLALLRGMASCWLVVGLFLYAYLLGGRMGYGIFLEGRDVMDYGLEVGLLMMTMSALASSASWTHASLILEAKSDAAPPRMKAYGIRVYALILLLFTLGGAFLASMALGWAAWFFEDLLGW